MSLEIERWLNDTAVLSNLRTSWNDELEIVNDRLHLKKGQHSRSRGRSVTSDPTAIANYLESLITNTAQQRFQTLQSSKEDTPAYYEQVASFKKQVKYLCTRTSDLEYTFSSHDCNNQSHAKRYSQLFQLASTFLNQVKEYKATLKKPPLEERPVKHIEYNERTDLHTIKWSYPKRVPIEETVAAAKQALLLAQPQQPPFIRYIKVIGKGLLFAIPLVIASFLTVLKIVFWNPFEWLIRAEVRTISPLRWLLQKLRTDNRHMRAYQSFSTQLFHQPFITEKVAQAFKQLAPQAHLLDLHNAVLACEDITKLAPFIEEDRRNGAIPLVTYLSTMQRLCKQKKISFQTLDSVSDFYKLHNNIYLKPNREGRERQSIDDFLDAMSDLLKKKPDLEKPCAVNPYISPKALQEVLKAASSSPTCREIQLSSSLIKLQSVRDFLASHSYRLKEDGVNRKTYRRYSLI